MWFQVFYPINFFHVHMPVLVPWIRGGHIIENVFDLRFVDHGYNSCGWGFDQKHRFILISTTGER
jgi:hypothetical protein